MISDYERMCAGLIAHILKEGELRPTRNGETIGLFAKTFNIDTNQIPVLSGRKMYYKAVLGELAAMFRDPKHINDFKDMGCNYWDAWADELGGINIDYGNVWHDFNGFNQMEELKRSLVEAPYSRRHIISGWRPNEVENLSLPCCHMLYQWYVTTEGKLNMIWYQRSVDVMLGLPANVILATVWNQLLANELGLINGTVNFMLGDVHIYREHLPGVEKYMMKVKELESYKYSRTPSNIKLVVEPGMHLEDFKPDMIEEIHYSPEQPIKMECKV